MKLTGIQCKNMERYYGLRKEIEMFERERLAADPTNIHKYKSLYELIYKLQDQLIKEELI